MFQMKNLKGKILSLHVVVRYADGTQTESVEFPMDTLVEPGDMLEIEVTKLADRARASKDTIRERVRGGVALARKEGFYGKRG